MDAALEANPRPDYQPIDRHRLAEEVAPRNPLPAAGGNTRVTKPRPGKHPAVKLRDAAFEALREKRINRPAFCVAMAIAQHVDEHGEAWPSNDRIGEMLGLHPGSVSRLMNQLKAVELVVDKTAEQPRRKGGWWSSRRVQVRTVRT